MQTAGAKGIGARLPRKEDIRFLHGRGKFVGDLAMPALMEVAFLRSPLAHARIKAIRYPEALKGRVFTAEDLAKSGVKPIRTPHATPGFKVADYPALATDQV